MKIIEEMFFDTIEGKFSLVVGENEMGERHLYSSVAYALKQLGPGDTYPKEEEIFSCGHKVDISRLEGLIAKVKAK